MLLKTPVNTSTEDEKESSTEESSQKRYKHISKRRENYVLLSDEDLENP